MMVADDPKEAHVFEIREVNIAIELWGVAFSALGILCTLLFGRAEGPRTTPHNAPTIP